MGYGRPARATTSTSPSISPSIRAMAGRWKRTLSLPIRDGRPVTHTSFADGVKYMEFTEAVQISMAEGRRVELPLD